MEQLRRARDARDQSAQAAQEDASGQPLGRNPKGREKSLKGSGKIPEKPTTGARPEENGAVLRKESRSRNTNEVSKIKKDGTQICPKITPHSGGKKSIPARKRGKGSIKLAIRGKRKLWFCTRMSRDSLQYVQFSKMGKEKT